MTEPVFANDLTYSLPEDSPVESLKSALAFAVDDWGDSRAKAWVYGIVLGWGDEGHEDDAHPEIAARFGWSAEQVARLRRLHAAFEAFGASNSSEQAGEGSE